MTMLFADRADAGRRLARRLSRYRDAAPLILALPRGGVPVASEIARMLQAPLSLLMVRKVGVPRQPELALGAVVDGDDPHVIVNEAIAVETGHSLEEVQRLAEAELVEIERRRRHYGAPPLPASLSGRTVVLVDDGIATGASARAGLKSLKSREADRIILAVPVAPAETLAKLRGEAEEIVCLDVPATFTAVGQAYADFDQVEDATVVRLLREAAERLSSGRIG